MSIRIAAGFEIADDELTFTASRSGGPGGQHVNKTSSRVTLRFDLVHSPSIPDDARAKLLEALQSRLAADGTLRVVCQSSRSQFMNRRAAEARLAEILTDALIPRTPRVATKVPPAERRRRTDTKKLKSRIKRSRARLSDEGD